MLFNPANFSRNFFAKFTCHFSYYAILQDFSHHAEIIKFPATYPTTIIAEAIYRKMRL